MADLQSSHTHGLNEHWFEFRAVDDSALVEDYNLTVGDFRLIEQGITLTNQVPWDVEFSSDGTTWFTDFGALGIQSAGEREFHARRATVTTIQTH